jgi:hypothetical protein
MTMNAGLTSGELVRRVYFGLFGRLKPKPLKDTPNPRPNSEVGLQKRIKIAKQPELLKRSLE